MVQLFVRTNLLILNPVNNAELIVLNYINVVLIIQYKNKS